MRLVWVRGSRSPPTCPPPVAPRWEVGVGSRYVVQVAAKHDRFSFGPYSEIYRHWNRTSARWAGTSLRVGFGYALTRPARTMPSP